MANTYFRVIAERIDGERLRGTYDGTADTGGPWDPRLQHGGPPNALAVRAAERLAAGGDGHSHDRAPDRSGDRRLVAYRVAAEFLGPVPVGEVAVSATLVRAARSASLVQVVLTANGRECLHARVWLVAATDTDRLAAPSAVCAPPDVEQPFGLSFPYADSVDWRVIGGSATEPGPAQVWARPRLPLVEGEELTGLQRAALLGDSASGVSAELDWSRWSFLNVDLDVHLARPVQGEWLLLDARTQLGDRGAALARSTLSDAAGVVGCTAQTLIVARRAG